MTKDSLFRSILKTITWRVTASLTTILLVYWVTGTLEAAISIGILESASKILLYFIHERAWIHIQSSREVF